MNTESLNQNDSATAMAPQPSAAESAVLSDVQQRAAEYSERALLLAGYALWPRQPTDSDARLAGVLLREALLATAVAFSNQESLRSACDALAALSAFPQLAPWLTPARCALLVAALDSDLPGRVDDLRQAEHIVAQIVQARAKNSRRPRSTRLRWAALALVALIVAAVVIVVSLPGPRWKTYPWRTSSSAWGFGPTGTLGEHGTADLVFHTKIIKGSASRSDAACLIRATPKRVARFFSLVELRSANCFSVVPVDDYKSLLVYGLP